MPQVVENLEIHAAHACNLSCDSCSHFSNHHHAGILSLAEAASWMRPWEPRLQPKKFSILGGEPTLNQDLPELFLVSRQHWPDAMIRIVTNGYYLHRHPDLPRLMAVDGNALLCLSVHHPSKTYLDSIAPHVSLLESWIERYNIKVSVYLSYSHWTRRYKGFGSSMEPFEDNDIRSSWERCPAKLCRQLFEQKIWKCSPWAYLQLQARKYELSEKWSRYVSYTPLGPDCSEEELQAFFSKEEEAVCGMCPAEAEKVALGYPARRSLHMRERGEVETDDDHAVLGRLRRIRNRNTGCRES